MSEALVEPMIVLVTLKLPLGFSFSFQFQMIVNSNIEIGLALGLWKLETVQLNITRIFFSSIGLVR